MPELAKNERFEGASGLGTGTEGTEGVAEKGTERMENRIDEAEIWGCLVWDGDKPVRFFHTIDKAYNWSKYYLDGEPKLTWSLVPKTLLIGLKETW